MAYQILVLTSEYLAQYMEDILKEYSSDIICRIVKYRQFSEIASLYHEHECWADGVLTTGIVVETILKREVKGSLKPVLSLNTDNETLYKIPLMLLIQNRQLDPDRIIFDVFVCTSSSASVLELVENKSVNDMFPDFYKWLDAAPAKELRQIDERCVRQIRELWDEDKIDMVICRYSSIVERLKELGIPCIFAASSDEYARQIVDHLLEKVKLEKITAHLPAVIFAAPAAKNGDTWNEYQELHVRKAILDFAREHDLKFLLQHKGQGLLAITEKTVVSYITDSFSHSVLSEYLKDSVGFDLTVSYGIGHTVEEALEHVWEAKKASGNSVDAYLVDEERRLKGPLDKERTVLTSDMINPQMQAIAKHASLSTTMIHRLNRLLYLLDKREITSRELAEHFHITVREASRILKHLETAGFASVALHKSDHLRGRPTKIYRIKWKI